MQAVTYFDLVPTAVSGIASLLGKYVVESHSAPDNRGFLLLQEIVRPNRFVLVETWQDRAAIDGRNPARAALREALEPRMIGGFDARVHSELSMSPPKASTARPIYTVTHVDVFPAGMPRAVELVRAEAAAARDDAGNIRFDVLRWDGHPNHFTLVSAWRDRRAAEASLVTPHARQFRAALTPLEGAPYDGRLYRAWP